MSDTTADLVHLTDTCGSPCGRVRTLRLMAERYRTDPDYRQRVTAAARQRAQRYRSPAAHWPVRHCPRCSTEYRPQAPVQTYCSRRCARATQKQRARLRARAADRTARLGDAA